MVHRFEILLGAASGLCRKPCHGSTTSAPKTQWTELALRTTGPRLKKLTFWKVIGCNFHVHCWRQLYGVVTMRAKANVTSIQGGCTNFPEIWKLSENPWRRKSDKKHVSYWRCMIWYNCNWVVAWWQYTFKHKQDIEQHKEQLRWKSAGRLCEFYPGICHTTQGIARKKTQSEYIIYILPKHPHITKPSHTHARTHAHTHTTKPYKTTTVQIKTKYT
jgi:hypothetical protein